MDNVHRLGGIVSIGYDGTGRYLGPIIDIAPDMTVKILKPNV